MDSIRTKNERKVNSHLMAGQMAKIRENFFSKHPRTPSENMATTPYCSPPLTLR